LKKTFLLSIIIKKIGNKNKDAKEIVLRDDISCNDKIKSNLDFYKMKYILTFQYYNEY